LIPHQQQQAGKHALRQVRRMRTYVGRLHRDIGRQIVASQPWTSLPGSARSEMD
jgi:hypothetical protein